MWERPLWEEMCWWINRWGKAWDDPNFYSVLLQFLILLHLPVFNSNFFPQTGNCDALLAPSQCLTQQNSPFYVGIDIFTNIPQHVRKHGNHMPGYEYLWPVFKCISEYLLVSFFLFFNFSTMWISDFGRLCGGLLDFVWRIVLIHSFRNPLIEKPLKNMSYYSIKPHKSKYTWRETKIFGLCQPRT